MLLLVVLLDFTDKNHTRLKKHDLSTHFLLQKGAQSILSFCFEQITNQYVVILTSAAGFLFNPLQYQRTLDHAFYMCN